MISPFVSIIIPVYNVELYFEACIQSVMRQTYEGPMECIIVDDGSTDKSISIAEDLISRYNGPIAFRFLRHDHTRGASAARNTGMDAATGDYYCFLDSDDELTEDCIKVLVKPLEVERYDLVVGAMKIVGSDAPFNGLKLKLSDRNLLRGTDILSTYKLKWNVCPVAKLYKAELINSCHLRFLEGTVFEDELWNFQVAYFARSLFPIQHVVYLYRKHAGGVMASTYGEKQAACLSIIVKSMGTFAKENGIHNKRVHQIVNSLFLSALRVSRGEEDAFKSRYFLLKPYAKPSFRNLVLSNGIRIQRYLRDMHYYLPGSLAPRWLSMYFNLKTR